MYMIQPENLIRPTISRFPIVHNRMATRLLTIMHIENAVIVIAVSPFGLQAAIEVENRSIRMSVFYHRCIKMSI